MVRIRRGGERTGGSAVMLRYEVTPDSNQLCFRYVLASEEHGDSSYVTPGFDDTAIISVGEQRCGLPIDTALLVEGDVSVDVVDLLDELRSLIDGLANTPSLMAKIDRMTAAVEAGRTASACGSSKAFANEVRALSGHRIPTATAEALGDGELPQRGAAGGPAGACGASPTAPTAGSSAEPGWTFTLGPADDGCRITQSSEMSTSDVSDATSAITQGASVSPLLSVPGAGGSGVVR